MTALMSEMVKDALPELFVEKNVVAAGQEFQRRLVEYEMNIEQQKLLREDLRDLVELTVGRMDIYHLVGALLLEFSIGLFCTNSLLVETEEHELPGWLLTFFLLSNVCAAGYLCMAVWLSMHASVAAHSIGVRLLINSARLSIPTREELEEVTNVPLVGLRERFANLGKRLGYMSKEEPPLDVSKVEPHPLRKSKTSASNFADLDPDMMRSTDSVGNEGASSRRMRFDSNKFRSTGSDSHPLRKSKNSASNFADLDPGIMRSTDCVGNEGTPGAGGIAPAPVVPLWQSESALHDESGHQCPQHTYFAAYADAGIHGNLFAADTPARRAIDEGANAMADRSAHFRQFLQEQRRWVNYDAYARVCMSLGINQMLTALSYYIIGTFTLKAPRSALMCLFGIQLLSLLLLRLDIVPGDNANPRGDGTMVFLFVPVPPIYLALIICTWDLHMVSDFFLSIMALPAFCLHSSWLMLVCFVLIPREAVDNEALPTRLRTVLFLDVINPDNEDVAQARTMADTRQTTDLLSDARLLLEDRMQEIMQDEIDAGEIRKANRHNEELEELEDALHEHLANAEEERFQLGAVGDDPEGCREAEERMQRIEIASAHKTLSHLKLWRMAPEVHANLAALRSVSSRGWHDEESKQAIELWYQEFLQECKVLDLGIWTSRKAGIYCFVDERSEGSESSDKPLESLRVVEEDALMVRIAAPDLCGGTATYAGENSVWVEQGSSRLQHAPPEDRRATSFATVLESVLPQFSELAAAFHQSGSFSPGRIIDITPDAKPVLRRSTDRGMKRAARRLTNAFTSFVPTSMRRGALRQLLPASPTQAEHLPGVLVRRWSLSLAILWILGAFLHSVDYGKHDMKPGRRNLFGGHNDGHGHSQDLL